MTEEVRFAQYCAKFLTEGLLEVLGEPLKALVNVKMSGELGHGFLDMMSCRGFTLQRSTVLSGHGGRCMSAKRFNKSKLDHAANEKNNRITFSQTRLQSLMDLLKHDGNRLLHSRNQAPGKSPFNNLLDDGFDCHAKVLRDEFADSRFVKC